MSLFIPRIGNVILFIAVHNRKSHWVLLLRTQRVVSFSLCSYVMFWYVFRLLPKWVYIREMVLINTNVNRLFGITFQKAKCYFIIVSVAIKISHDQTPFMRTFLWMSAKKSSNAFHVHICKISRKPIVQSSSEPMILKRRKMVIGVFPNTKTISILWRINN